jgi:hypothetical protein
MAQSVTGIANRALQLLGAGSIMNLTDNTPEARECTRCYDSCRRAELRKQVWNFATARVQLAPDTAAPAFDYAYQFSLPVDCVRIILVNDPSLDWKEEGRKILTNAIQSPFGYGAVAPTATSGAAPILKLTYVYDVQDPTLFDPLFCELVSASMAQAMCERLTQSNQKKADAHNAYLAALDEAKHADSLETLPVDAPEDDWVLARMG